MSDMRFSFDRPTRSMHGRAASGITKTGLSQGLRLLVQFGSVIILSRLLVPAQFGILAMVGPVVAFVSLFQDLGLTQAIVQKPEITHDEVSALFFVSLGMSVALAIALFVAAPLAGLFYGEPRVVALTAAMGLNVVLGGAGSTQYALLNRSMRFGALALIDVVPAVAGLVISAVFAMIYHNFWSIYAGIFVSTLIPTASHWELTKWRPSLPGRWAGAGGALRFGANVTGFNLANFFARNLANVLIGKVQGERPLGLYNCANKLLLRPLQQINAAE